METIKNDSGDHVEEFEIQFIEGDDLVCVLAKAIDLNHEDDNMRYLAIHFVDEGLFGVARVKLLVLRPGLLLCRFDVGEAIRGV